jgi:hypothetical protein
VRRFMKPLIVDSVEAARRILSARRSMKDRLVLRLLDELIDAIKLRIACGCSFMVIRN